MGVGVAKETVGFLGVSSYRAHNGLRTYADSLPLGSRTGAAAGGTTAEHRNKLKSLAPGKVLGDSFLLDKTPEARQRP